MPLKVKGQRISKCLLSQNEFRAMVSNAPSDDHLQAAGRCLRLLARLANMTADSSTASLASRHVEALRRILREEREWRRKQSVWRLRAKFLSVVVG